MLENAVETYGYAAILIGSMVEGETVLILGGFFAHRGYLALPWVILCAFAGSLFTDQLCFFMGRRNGARIQARFPAVRKKIRTAHRALERYQQVLILGFRFAYGFRLITPFVIGMSPTPTPVFVLFNVLGAALWAVVVGFGGYFFGNILEMLLGDLRRHEINAAAWIVLAGTAAWIIHQLRVNRSA